MFLRKRLGSMRRKILLDSFDVDIIISSRIVDWIVTGFAMGGSLFVVPMPNGEPYAVLEMLLNSTPSQFLSNLET